MTGADDKLSDAERKARALGRWANEGGAPAPEDPIGQEAPITTSEAGKPEGAATADTVCGSSALTAEEKAFEPPD